VRRGAFRIGWWCGAAIAGALLGGGAVHAACPPPVTDAAVVRSVGRDGTLVLADGREVVPAGIALAADAMPDLEAIAVGRTVLLRPLPRPQDRWGRLVAHLDLRALPGAAASPEDASLEELLLARGLGHAAAMGHDACMTQLIAAEGAARSRRLGVWRKPGYVLSATDVDELGRHLGDHVVVVGRVRSVRSLRSRAYINFAPHRDAGLSVVVRKRAWSRNGIGDAAGDSRLAGRRIRVRGHLGWQGGPLIELTDEEPVERLD
jgi:hypothetical protein